MYLCAEGPILLEHLKTYRLTSPEALQVVLGTDELPEGLEVYSFGREQTYYRFGKEAGEAVGCPELAGKLSEQELRFAIGRLSLCLLGERERPLLTPRSLEEEFPGVPWEPHYYLDRNRAGDKRYLGRVLVDLGMTWHRALRLVRNRLLVEAARTPGVAEVLAANRFAIGIASGNQSTLDKLRDCAKDLERGYLRLHYSRELRAIDEQ